MASRRSRHLAANPASTLAAANSPSKMTDLQPTAAPERSERPDTGEDRHHATSNRPGPVPPIQPSPHRYEPDATAARSNAHAISLLRDHPPRMSDSSRTRPRVRVL